MIGMNGKRESEKSVLSVWFDDDDEFILYYLKKNYWVKSFDLIDKVDWFI